MLFVGIDGRIVASSGAFFCFLDFCLVCPYAAESYIEKAENLSAYLLSVLNDILDMSRIEAGKVELEQKPFALEALAQKMRDLFQKNIEAKGVAFSVEMRDFDAHAWAEAYMDGIGWIPVDFTPGFYYNTYALLRMAELPQNIRKTAALEEQGDEAENVTGNTPQDGNADSESIPDPKITAELAWGIVLAFLFVLEVLFAVLELFRWRYEQKIRGPLPEEAEMAAGFLACAIAQNLRVCGIDLRPGWNTEQTENEIRSTFPEIPAGFYPRVNETLEKYVYGGAALMPQELRFLQRFLTALRDSRKQLGPRQRIALRYIGVLHGKDTLRHSNQI